MRSVPVDIAAFLANVRAPVGIHAVEDKAKGEQRTDAKGRPRWRLEVLYDTPDRDGHEVIRINFAATDRPELTPGCELILQGLTVSFWEMESRAGMTLNAEHVGMKPDNGTRQPVAA